MVSGFSDHILPSEEGEWFMKQDFAREIYYKENDIKSQLDARFNSCVSLLTLLGGLICFLIQGAWPGRSWAFGCSLFFSLLSITLLLILLYYIIKASVGYEYERMPRGQDLLEYSISLTDYYKGNKELASNEYETYITAKLVQAATHNTELNLSRSAKFHKAMVLFVAVAITILIAGIGYVLGKAINCQ